MGADGDGGPAACAVGIGRGGGDGLECAVAVGSAGEDVEAAVVGDDVGVDVPEDPGEGREGRGELGIEPGLTAVDGDFESGDAAITGKGDAVDAGHAAFDGLAGSGYVDTAGGFHACFLGPAALLPEAKDLLVEESDLRDPFGVLDAVLTGGEEAEGEAVAVGEGKAVHGVDERDLFLEGEVEGEAFGVVVGAAEADELGVGPWAGAFEKVAQGEAGPAGVGDEVAADFVADALERDGDFAGGHGADLVEGEIERVVDGSVDGEAPAVAVDAGVEEVLGDAVEVCVGGDWRCGEAAGGGLCAAAASSENLAADDDGGDGADGEAAGVLEEVTAREVGYRQRRGDWGEVDGGVGGFIGGWFAGCRFGARRQRRVQWCRDGRELLGGVLCRSRLGGESGEEGDGGEDG